MHALRKTDNGKFICNGVEVSEKVWLQAQAQNDRFVKRHFRYEDKVITERQGIGGPVVEHYITDLRRLKIGEYD